MAEIVCDYGILLINKRHSEERNIFVIFIAKDVRNRTAEMRAIVSIKIKIKILYRVKHI